MPVPNISFDNTKPIYFAYGSNLLYARLYARTPSIERLGIGQLHHHRLSFNKPGGDGSGKCGIEAAHEEAHVLGVLYQMDRHEMPALDEIEGVGHGYRNQAVGVNFNNAIISAFTYYPSRLDCERPPFDWYKNLVLCGAQENEFPSSYIAKIEQVQDQVDHNQQRRAANFAISSQMELPA